MLPPVSRWAAAGPNHAPVETTGRRPVLHISASCSGFAAVATCGVTLSLYLPRPPGLSGDPGLPPSRVAALVFGAHATPRGPEEPGTIRSPLPSERTAEERDEQIHRPSERRL